MKYILIFFLLGLFSSCFLRKEQDLDCKNVKTINDFLAFQNFNYEEVKDISIHYTENGLKKVVSIHHDSTDYNHRYNRFLGDKIQLTKGIEYFIHTKNNVIKLTIDSFAVHYQNTMISRNQVCSLGAYSVNGMKIEDRDITIDKNVIDTLKLK